MDYALRQALKKFDARRTEKLGPSESAVFTPDEKGAAMIADVFLPIAKYVIYGGHFHDAEEGTISRHHICRMAHRGMPLSANRIVALSLL